METKKTVTHYRCPPVLLKKLAGAPLFFNCGSAQPLLPDAAVASKAVTFLVQKEFAGDRGKAVKYCARKARKEFPFPPPARMQIAEQKVLEEWSLLAAAVLRPGPWSAADRKTFVQLVLSKARADEGRFIRLLQHHRRFWHDLAMIAG